MKPENEFPWDRKYPGRRNRKSWCFKCLKRDAQEREKRYKSGEQTPKKRWYLEDAKPAQNGSFEGVTIKIGVKQPVGEKPTEI
jgi:hypothetical protein